MRPARKAGRTARGLGEFVYALPVVVVIGILIVLPTASAVAHSFTNWQPGYSSPWVGLENYRELLDSDQFREILKNQAYLLLGVPLWTVAPLRARGAAVRARAVPGRAAHHLLLPGDRLAGRHRHPLQLRARADRAAQHGLRDIGLGGLASNWLADERLVKPVVIAVLAWATIGTGVVIFSAAMSAIPPELFEAAALDGGSWWQRFRHVTVPSVRRVIELWVVILVITVFVAVFPWIFTLTRGGPGYSSTTIDFDIYQNALGNGYFGTAAAEAVMLLIIVGVVVGFGGFAFGRRRAS